MSVIMNRALRFTKNQKGLTLIELLAIIVILGVIAAVAVPTVGNVIKNSKTKADELTIKSIESAALLYLVQEDPAASGTLLLTTIKNGGFLNDAPLTSQVDDTKKFHSVNVTYSTTNGYSVTTNPAISGAAPTQGGGF